MISEAELRKLLAHKSESRNLDFKERLNWSSTSNDEKCELVKDVLAFLNTENGGVIIFGIRDGTLELVGLTEDEFTSFDPTKVNDFLHRYTDPISFCEVQKFVIDNRHVVVIGVSEFNDVPVICKRDANSSKNQSKLILRAGGLYVRSHKATSGLVSSADEMRDLINRALFKRGEQLLKPIETLIQRAGEVYQNSLEAPKHNELLRKTLHELEESYDITIEALGDALDLNTTSTAGHSKRVTAFTIAIAKTIGLPSDQIRVMARGAFLHDIGKMGIPSAILLKPSALDNEEFKIVREHCRRGYQIAREIPFLAEAAEIVYAHHEKFDGTGYPRGLQGEKIPLGSRIVAVANTLDTMTSHQPCRAVLPDSAARDEIQHWSGRQFDPEVVKVFLSMPETIWPALREDIDQHTPIVN